MAKEEVDKNLIEQLQSGSIYDQKPEETDPTKLNEKDIEKGGGGQ